MKTVSTDQAGFSAFELIVGIVVVAIVAVAGLRILGTHNSTTSSSSGRGASGAVSAAPAVKTTKDLDKSQTILDQNDPATTSSSDAKQLDTQLNALN